MKHLTYDKLAKITRVCKNNRIKCKIEGGDDEWTGVGIMGPQLVSLYIYPAHFNSEICRQALVQCTNLRELDVGTGFGGTKANEDLASLFSAANYHSLESLVLSRFEPSQKNIDLISSRTSNLKRGNSAVRMMCGLLKYSRDANQFIWIWLSLCLKMMIWICLKLINTAEYIFMYCKRRARFYDVEALT